MATRILVTDGMDAGAMEQLRKDGFEVVEQFYEPDALGAALRDFDAVIIRSATKIKAPQIDEAKGGKLKLIIRAGRGHGQHRHPLRRGRRHRLPQHPPRLFQRCGRASSGSAVLLRPEYFYRRSHYAGEQVGEKSLFQGL